MSSASPSPATSYATPPPPSSATTPPPPPPQQPSSPSPNSSASLPPETSPPPPPSQSAPPPAVPSVPPPSQPSPPPSSQSSPPPSQSSPPPSSQLSPPPSQSSPPPSSQSSSPPSQSSPPPSSQLSPPPSQSSPPTSPSLPLPSPQTLPPSSPAISPPPPESPVLVPPQSSPPSPSASPPPNPSPPPASPPQENSPPPPTAVPPPRSSPSPPPENSTQTPPPSPSPPVAAVPPPRSSPTPPSASPPVAAVPPPRSSPTPPSASPPVAAVPPPRSSPTPPVAVPPPRSSQTPPSASPPVAAVPPPRSSPTPPSASPPVAVPPPRSSRTPPSASPPTPPLASPPTPLPPPPPSTPPTTPSSQPVTPSNSTPSFQSAPPPPRLLLSPPPPPNESEDSSPEAGSSDGISTGVVVVIAVFGGILLLGLIAIALWCLRRKNKKEPPHDGYVMPYNHPSSTESDSSSLKIHSSAPLIKSGSGSDVVNSPSDPGGLGHSRNWFSYEELLQATNGFSTQNLLGEGGFGSVFKGCLPDGREIAVKQLKIGGSQGEREFKAEVEIISRIHHRHLVSLVGYCIQDTRRLLVYDYVPNNTLHFHLHGEGQPVLEWAHRVKIAVGTARGIAYLHEDCNPRVIHRDIKPSNILLDYNYEARVADFGLAKLALDACTHISTRVMGTFGYVAPEYASTGNLTERSDVYSFGVVLLELITGRKAVDRSQPLGDESLVEWARPLLSHALETEEFDSVADERLQKNYIESEMFCMIETAAACVRHSASKRPRMGQVVRAFESLATSDLSNGMRPGESQVGSSTLQSEEIRLFQRMAFNNQTVSTGFFVQDSLHT